MLIISIMLLVILGLSMLNKSGGKKKTVADYCVGKAGTIVKAVASIIKYKNEYRIDDVKAIVAFIIQESKFYVRATGDDGRSIGLCQIMLTTAKTLGFTGTREQLYDIDTNIKWGLMYYRDMLKKESGNIYNAWRAYNGGPGWRGSQKAVAMTKIHADKILIIYNNLDLDF